MARSAQEGIGFDEFVAARAGSLFRTAYLLVHHRESAEDLVQSALERAYPRWRRIQRTGSPEAYVRRIIINLANDNWRSGKGVQWHELDEEQLSFSRTPVDADPSERVAMRDMLIRALRSLPFRMRAVLVLRHWEGLTERETAEALGVSVGTVKAQNSRGLERLRALVGPSGSGVPMLAGPPSGRSTL